MVRKRRELSSTGIYHIMIRGNEKRNIFLDDDDREKFINILFDKKKDNEYKLYAYCLMNNHVHLLLKEEKEDISRNMKRINISYAYYFNKKYERVGHVFQDRFKSETVEDDIYLLQVIRYIHNNPVKAGIVKSPLKYKWSSYSSYTSKGYNKNSIVDNNFILLMFSKNKREAVKLFIEYSLQENEDVFIDERKKEKKKKIILTEKAARDFIDKFLNKNNLKLDEIRNKENKKLRNELILELRKKSNLSIRNISSLLKISRGVVQNVKT
ncbi:REP-associated tyrosine transposase [Maledivibacter halophilus]|uniref:REP element-mobilizing transposase RayT n=1 Tax=Maledivibacter halophilus TaxID=36842 RepID=A0A1T5IML5_9FIRM|nr:transposase [Maledivibacter halophilus]SKC40454.1 REP element-mobilizing transposase RayT [Maledivibacter halophilus]